MSTKHQPAIATNALEADADRASAHAARADDHWLVRDPLRSAVLVITVLALAVRFSVVKDSYFITDDFMLSSRAMESPLSWGYLTRVHTGHFEPIGFGTMWLLAHFAPLSWGWTVVVLIAGQALLSYMVWKLLVELFDRRLLNLVPYAVFAFTPLTLPAFTWLAAAIIWLPMMIAIAGACRWHVRYVRSGRSRDAIIASLWFMVGLASFEKVVIYLPFVVALTFAVSPEIRGRVGPLVTLIRRTWLVWVGYLVVSAAYLVVYLPGVRSVGNDSPLTAPKAGPLSDFLFLSVFRTLIPATFGGPWKWQPSSYALAIVDSPRAFDWLCWILGAGVLVASLALRRNISRFWLAFGIYLLGSMAAIAAGRVAYGGAIVALETRYLADAIIPLVITLGACLMPLRGELNPWMPQASRLAASTPRTTWAATAVAASVAMVGLSFHAMGGYAQFSTNNPARAFVTNTKASLDAMPEDAQIYDTALPGDIIGPLFANYNRVSRYVSPLLTSEQRADAYTQRFFTKPYVISQSGAFAPMDIALAAKSTGAPGSCLPQDRGRVRVPLTSNLFEWSWAVRIGYIADAATTATIRMGDASRSVQLNKGLGEVFVSVVAAGDEVLVEDIPPGVTVCVGDVQVGNPIPATQQ